MPQHPQPMHWLPVRGFGFVGSVCLLGMMTGLVGISGCRDAVGEATASADEHSAQEKNPDAKATRVNTVRVEQRDLSDTVEMPATVEGYEMAELHAKVGGYLESIAVDIGDEVQKGDVLATLWAPELQQKVQQKQAAVRQAESQVAQAAAMVAQAQADLKAARAAEREAESGLAKHQAQVRFREAEHHRFQELVSQQAIDRKMLDEARFQLESAQAAVKSAQAHIATAAAETAAAEASVARAEADREAAEANVAVAKSEADLAETMANYLVIRAPDDGVILRRYVDPGAFIRAGQNDGTALLKFARIDRVRVVVDVPMADTPLLDVGDRADLSRLPTRPGESFEGVVSRFAPGVDRDSRLARVEIDFDNADRRLMPGHYGYMTIHLAEQANTPVVPSSAVLSDAEGAYVLVVADDLAERRAIEIGYQDGSIVGVTSGLSGGEQVILAGGSQITAGQPVDAVLAQK